MSSKSQDLIDTLSKAYVIIMNENAAIVLKYDDSIDSSPVVVAKGEDEITLPIKVIGCKEIVYLVHNPHVAELLYACTEVGEYIPEQLSWYVAEIMVNVATPKTKNN